MWFVTLLNEYATYLVQLSLGILGVPNFCKHSVQDSYISFIFEPGHYSIKRLALQGVLLSVHKRISVADFVMYCG